MIHCVGHNSIVGNYTLGRRQIAGLQPIYRNNVWTLSVPPLFRAVPYTVILPLYTLTGTYGRVCSFRTEFWVSLSFWMRCAMKGLLSYALQQPNKPHLQFRVGFSREIFGLSNCFPQKCVRFTKPSRQNGWFMGNFK